VLQLVAIDLPGGPGFVDALRRIWDDGDAALPVDQRLSVRAKQALLDLLRPSTVCSTEGKSGRPGGLPVEAGDALVVATSGTTGTPKGVVLDHRAVAASARATSERLAVDPGRHRWLACLPLNHVGGLSVITRSLLTDTPVTVLAGFDAEQVRTHSGADVFVSLVPTTLSRLGPAMFHTVVLGGSAPPADLAANVVTTYGMTETGSGVVYDGTPLAGVEVAVDPGTSEISLRGPMLLRAYRDGTCPLDRDGWLPTGDSGWIDDGGRLHIQGRLSDMIVTGGENVWPEAVERAIRGHPGVAEVAVAGRPDPKWGERVVAWVVPRAGHEPPHLGDLRALVAENLAPYAAPRELLLVESLPRTGIGKVRRDRLGPL
jgi:O-succinylbenzoic acid--CoA ligase